MSEEPLNRALPYEPRASPARGTFWFTPVPEMRIKKLNAKAVQAGWQARQALPSRVSPQRSHEIDKNSL